MSFEKEDTTLPSILWRKMYTYIKKIPLKHFLWIEEHRFSISSSIDVPGWASNGSWNPKQLSENAFYMGVIAFILHKIRCIIQLTLFQILFACGDSLWKFVHHMDIQIFHPVEKFQEKKGRRFSFNIHLYSFLPI